MFKILSESEINDLKENIWCDLSRWSVVKLRREFVSKEKGYEIRQWLLRNCNSEVILAPYTSIRYVYNQTTDTSKKLSHKEKLSLLRHQKVRIKKIITELDNQYKSLSHFPKAQTRVNEKLSRAYEINTRLFEEINNLRSGQKPDFIFASCTEIYDRYWAFYFEDKQVAMRFKLVYGG